MRVLQINHYCGISIGSHRRLGGMEKVVWNLAEGMQQAGWTSCILSCQHVRQGTTEEHLKGVRVCRTGSVGFVFSSPISPSFPMRYVAEVRRADVIHVHVPSPFCEFVMAGLPLPNKPLVLTWHTGVLNSRYSWLGHVYRPVIRRLLRHASVLCFSSERNVPEELCKGVHGKICIVPLGVRLPARSEFEAAMRARAVRADDRFKVLFVGRLVYYKGVDVLLRAIERVKRCELVVVGRGEDSRRLQRLANELGVGDRVRFAGYVSEDRLGGLYRAADVFVLPSTTSAEAFGLSQIEAMAWGCPVVNTRLGTGVSDVSVDGRTGLSVEPGDVDSLAVALNRLGAESETRFLLGRAARSRAKAYSVEAMVQRYAGIYENLCGMP